MSAAMGEFFGSAWWFIVTLGVLVTFHEFGHYWVARRCGVRVLTFSIGFGRALWSRIGKDGTQYQVAAIPLGGYVKFLDGREVDLMPGEHAVAFDRQPVWKRILIVLAGPVANLLLCLALLWVALQVGVPEATPVLGEPTGLATEAGFAPGDRVLAVDGKSATTWDQAIVPLAIAAIDHRPVVVSVRDARGRLHDRTLDLARLPAGFDQTDPLAAMGLHALATQDRPVVGRVLADGAAAGKLEPGDRILAIEGHRVHTFSGMIPRLQSVAAPGRALKVDVRRGDRDLALLIEPRRVINEQGKPAWQFGIGPRPEDTLVRYAAVPAARETLLRTADMTRQTFAIIGRLLTGQASARNVSGVIGIAQAANSQASIGLGRMLAFMAALSLALCIMNLLPIPVLDGGHLLYYLIELVAGRPLSDRVLVAGQYVGLALLAGLITLAFYNDLTRLVS
jgi:regulator of sigma E protease